MMKYRVELASTRVKTVKVEAESVEDAAQKATAIWRAWRLVAIKDKHGNKFECIGKCESCKSYLFDIRKYLRSKD